MVSPSFAIRDPRGRAPFPSRSRLCRSARGARVDILRLVRGNFGGPSDNRETSKPSGSMGTNRRFTTRQKYRERSPMGKQYGQSLESPRAEAGKAQSRSADYLRLSQLRARRQVAASHTRRRTSPARENAHAARPSRRIREDSGRTLGRDNRDRRGFGTGEKTVWASSETTPVTPWWIARPRSGP